MLNSQDEVAFAAEIHDVQLEKKPVMTSDSRQAEVGGQGTGSSPADD